MGSGHLHHLSHDRSLGLLRVVGAFNPAATTVYGQGFTVEKDGIADGEYTITLESQINVNQMAVLAGPALVSAVDPATKSFVLNYVDAAGDPEDPAALVAFEAIVWTTAAQGAGL